MWYPSIFLFPQLFYLLYPGKFKLFQNWSDDSFQKIPILQLIPQFSLQKRLLREYLNQRKYLPGVWYEITLHVNVFNYFWNILIITHDAVQACSGNRCDSPMGCQELVTWLLQLELWEGKSHHESCWCEYENIILKSAQISIRIKKKVTDVDMQAWCVQIQAWMKRILVLLE